MMQLTFVDINASVRTSVLSLCTAVLPPPPQMPPYVKQIQRFCFTHNNYSTECVDYVKDVIGPLCIWMICGKEVAPTTGTPHLQCFAYLKNKMSENKINKSILKFPNGAYSKAIPAKGNNKHQYDYCSKGGDFFEVGTRPQDAGEAGGAAEQNRWADIARLAKDKENYDEFYNEILELYPDVALNMIDKLPKYFNQINKANVPKKTDVICEWLQGPPGTGKSHTAREENPDAYVKCATGKWFDGYNNEECIILEDLDMNSLRDIASIIKQLCDKYQLIVEVKGGSKAIRPKKIVVTSNYSIAHLFPEPTMCAAMTRRFTVRKFLIPYVPDEPATNPPEPNIASDEEEDVQIVTEVTVPPDNLW